ncbi:DUF2239 family protein [Novosphingobium sp. ST904]|uniref:DUF2239 family protein n=1 Tax=Novosphingobium sp. ST904 TaxID=1684385 RepID=UPI0035126A61
MADRTGGPEVPRRIGERTLGGDLPGFEKASRLLFADKPAELAAALAPWPADLRDHLLELAQPRAED